MWPKVNQEQLLKCNKQGPKMPTKKTVEHEKKRLLEPATNPLKLVRPTDFTWIMQLTDN